MDEGPNNPTRDGSAGDADVGSSSVSAAGDVDSSDGRGVNDERGVARAQVPGRIPRRRGPSPLIFVFVLTGVGMLFAILVVVWMYWLQGMVPATPTT